MHLLAVARRRDGEESRCQLPRPIAVENDFRTWLRRQFISVNDAAALEMLGIALGIGHVISVRQEDVGDAAKGLQLLYERRDELGRVNEPISCGVANEVAVSAIRLRGVVPAVEDRLLNDEREVLHHRLHVSVAKT